ncbi:MAG: DUF4236 domain-containing protein [Proteobacteria bacterium]|nr:DUF4236 domain-containing protein [Pseudomonadota bacterium]
MGWRFQKRISILPGVRINIGKRGVSTSVGPKGADINIGRHGVTTNAGLPGTGLSYRQTLGHPGSWLGIGLFVVALAFAAYRAGYVHLPTTGAPAAEAGTATSLRYVRRGNSVLRTAPSPSAPALAHEAKGTQVTVLAVEGPWSKVNDGTNEGWMRSSVLGER